MGNEPDLLPGLGRTPIRYWYPAVLLRQQRPVDDDAQIGLFPAALASQSQAVTLAHANQESMALPPPTARAVKLGWTFKQNAIVQLSLFDAFKQLVNVQLRPALDEIERESLQKDDRSPILISLISNGDLFLTDNNETLFTLAASRLDSRLRKKPMTAEEFNDVTKLARMAIGGLKLALIDRIDTAMGIGSTSKKLGYVEHSVNTTPAGSKLDPRRPKIEGHRGNVTIRETIQPRTPVYEFHPRAVVTGTPIHEASEDGDSANQALVDAVYPTEEDSGDYVVDLRHTVSRRHLLEQVRKRLQDLDNQPSRDLATICEHCLKHDSDSLLKQTSKKITFDRPQLQRGLNWEMTRVRRALDLLALNSDPGRAARLVGFTKRDAAIAEISRDGLGKDVESFLNCCARHPSHCDVTPQRARVDTGQIRLLLHWTSDRVDAVLRELGLNSADGRWWRYIQPIRDRQAVLKYCGRDPSAYSISDKKVTIGEDRIAKGLQWRLKSDKTILDIQRVSDVFDRLMVEDDPHLFLRLISQAA